jgi:hypothetical protein
MWTSVSPWRGAGAAVRRACAAAGDKFNADKKGMLLIPVVAAFVGWLTNWLAVKMIFYPIVFWARAYTRPLFGST